MVRYEIRILWLVLPNFKTKYLQNFTIWYLKECYMDQDQDQENSILQSCWNLGFGGLDSGCGMDGVGNTGVTWPPNIQLLTSWTGLGHWDSTMQVKTIQHQYIAELCQMLFKIGNLMWSSDVLTHGGVHTLICARHGKVETTLMQAGDRGGQGRTGSQAEERQKAVKIFFSSSLILPART